MAAAEAKSVVDDIRGLLEDWARWDKIDNDCKKIGFKSSTSFARLMKPTPGEWGHKMPLIEHEMAELVDKVVSTLGVICLTADVVDLRYEILTDFYLKPMKDAQIARARKMDRRTVASIRSNAENYVAGAIDSHLWSR